MKFTKSLFFFLSFTFLFFCSKDDDKVEGNKVEFVFLQLNDVYEIAPIQAGDSGGMARVETVHQELLQENKNTMLFVAGDFLNPSLLGTIKVDEERIQGKQMVEVMNAMNFDLVAFGNHEFDLSIEDLQKRLNESEFSWISANVKLKTKGAKTLFYKERDGGKEYVNETFIKEIIDEDGTKIKIGFISVCIPSNLKASYVEYDDIFFKAKSSYDAIKDSVEIVFGLTHINIADDKNIAKLIPDLPLIMGGHEHVNKFEKIGNVTIAKADANAKTVYIHRISYDKMTKKTTIKSELKEINSSIKPDERVEVIVDKWQNILNTQIKDVIKNPTEIIYKTNISIDGRDTSIRSTQTNLGQIITKAMSFAYDDKVDCALISAGSIRVDDQLVGNITAIDIFRVLPYGGHVFKVNIKGKLLKRVLDYGKLAKGTGAYLHRYNVEISGESWLIKRKPIDVEKTYTVALSEKLLIGSDIPFLTEDNKEVLSIYRPKERELATDIRKSVIFYLKSL